jgi:hypothetical protein
VLGAGCAVQEPEDEAAQLAAPVEPSVVPSDAPPLIEPLDSDEVFSTFYADNDWLLIGDNHGRIRVRALMPASKVGSSSKAAKLAGLLLDGEGASVEYLNQAVQQAGKKGSPARAGMSKSPPRAGPPSPAQRHRQRVVAADPRRLDAPRAPSPAVGRHSVSRGQRHADVGQRQRLERLRLQRQKRNSSRRISARRKCLSVSTHVDRLLVDL